VVVDKLTQLAVALRNGIFARVAIDRCCADGHRGQPGVNRWTSRGHVVTLPPEQHHN
jgi:hypothetical protein